MVYSLLKFEVVQRNFWQSFCAALPKNSLFFSAAQRAVTACDRWSRFENFRK
ncbi:MAG: hypothetical protein IM535_12135 [Pseudanabaena sp. M38BS1SP1A06MG]|nr:hypothetical protein [Pseudanabaena sp. M53BS1SP1A06MG]MCA6592829.1 hypothetical protein [Pseudanabaena sp. M38BS1SP1A06MG]